MADAELNGRPLPLSPGHNPIPGGREDDPIPGGREDDPFPGGREDDPFPGGRGDRGGPSFPPFYHDNIQPTQGVLYFIQINLFKILLNETEVRLY